VYTVTRDFGRNCQTPILVLPDDVPGHPYVVALETVHLEPNAQVSLYPWKDTPDKIPLAVRHIRTFLRAIDLWQLHDLWQPDTSFAASAAAGTIGEVLKSLTVSTVPLRVVKSRIGSRVVIPRPIKR
jgi:hypothetical protein